MTFWEEKLEKEPLIRLWRQLGVEESAKSLKLSREEFLAQIQLLRFRYDIEDFSSRTLKISNKYGNVIPLVVNQGQRKIIEAVEGFKRAEKPVRIALLKARQFGGSTYFESEIFRDSVLRRGRESMIIAHDLDSARHLREMSERFYDYYPLEKPRIKKESEKWWRLLHFEGNKRVASNIRIDTAEELSTGHSLTLHNLHLSEVQNWRNARILVRGLFPTVPSSPDTMIFMEGTGSGVGDYWYDFCQMAQESTTEWAFVFVAWFEIEDYTLAFDNPEQRGDFEAKLDSEEKILRAQGIGLEQLNWRRLKIKDMGEDDFRQQYPSTPDEAFLTSGRPVFSAIKVKEAASRCEKPLRRGYLKWRTPETGKKYVEFEDDSRGYWEVWEERPEKVENLYCLGSDVAEGKEVIPGMGNRGGDYSAAKVMRRDSRQMVGKINVRLDPDLYADELEKAWAYWGCGLLIENNPGGSGNVVIRKLKRIAGVRLLSAPTLNRKYDDSVDSYGWRMTGGEGGTSKRVAIDELTERIRQENFEDLDKDFWYQASTYVRDEKGKTNAQQGKFDDLVIAGALTFQADKLMPMVFKEIPEERVSIPRDLDVPRNWKKKEGLDRERIVAENIVEF